MRPGARMKAAVEILDEILDAPPAGLGGACRLGQGAPVRGLRRPLGHRDARLRRAAPTAVACGADGERGAPRARHRGGPSRPRARPCRARCGRRRLAARARAPCRRKKWRRSPGRSIQASRPTSRATFPLGSCRRFERAFGDRAAEEGAGLARRAPVDLRVNTLKATREKVLKALEHAAASRRRRCRPWACASPPRRAPGEAHTSRLRPRTARAGSRSRTRGARSRLSWPALRRGLQVLDLCAGAGGKTLALAAEMENTGQIYAYDSDKGQLRPIFERLKRAGVRNVQVMDGGEEAALEALGGKIDIVLVDAPCTGSGTWRRRPEFEVALEAAKPRRPPERAASSAGAGSPPRQAGRAPRLCHLLGAARGERRPGRRIPRRPLRASRSSPWRETWRGPPHDPAPVSADGAAEMLLLTPASHGTDGFFVATHAARPVIAL